MGANAQTSVPLYAAGEILTAANMNISAGTGVPVFATTTTRDAAFGGTGEKTLAEGQYAYIESSNLTQYYDGATWRTLGGLVRVGGGALSGGSVVFTNVFSSAYDQYLVSVTNLTASGNFWLEVQIGAATTGYYFSLNGAAYGAVRTNFPEVVYGGASGGGGQFWLTNPFLSKFTVINAFSPSLVTAGNSGFSGGFLNNTTSYTDMTLSGATFTAGNVDIYGLAMS